MVRTNSKKNQMENKKSTNDMAKTSPNLFSNISVKTFNLFVHCSNSVSWQNHTNKQENNHRNYKILFSIQPRLNTARNRYQPKSHTHIFNSILVIRNNYNNTFVQIKHLFYGNGNS